MSDAQKRDIGFKTESHHTNLDRESIQIEELDIGTNGTLGFNLFSKLPMELRLKIWKEALTPPRYIDMWSVRGSWDFMDSIQIFCTQNAPTLFFYAGNLEPKTQRDMNRYEQRHLRVPPSFSATSRKIF